MPPLMLFGSLPLHRDVVNISTLRLHDLSWKDAVTPDGKADRVALVNQAPLQRALDNPQQSAQHALSRFLSRTGHKFKM